jgi:hypothetical protein
MRVSPPSAHAILGSHGENRKVQDRGAIARGKVEPIVVINGHIARAIHHMDKECGLCVGREVTRPTARACYAGKPVIGQPRPVQAPVVVACLPVAQKYRPGLGRPSRLVGCPLGRTDPPTPADALPLPSLTAVFRLHHQLQDSSHRPGPGQYGDYRCC